MLLKVKEFLMVACLAVFIVFINMQTVYIDVDADTIVEALNETAGLENMKEYTPGEIKSELGINVNDYKSVAYFGHDSVMECEMVLVICLDDASQGSELVDELTAKRKELMKLFQSYAPEQYELLSNSILEQKDKYVLYAVSENAEEVYNVFCDCITE